MLLNPIVSPRVSFIQSNILKVTWVSMQELFRFFTSNALRHFAHERGLWAAIATALKYRLPANELDTNR
jgi:hypothetical protein